jgi:protein-S-isoprenylcysteine O-methyltransferase Ste14
MTFPPVDLILIFLWGGFFAWWWISALRNRTPLKRAPTRFGFLTTMGIPAGIILVAAGLVAPSLYASRVLPDLLPVVIAGLLVVILGICFAIWARVHLGSNWSSRPAIHENHTITRTGPYVIIRHPIYTGILTGILGTAIATGSLLVFFCLPVILALFLVKIRMEEQFLIEEFGGDYERYRREVKALIPYVL